VLQHLLYHSCTALRWWCLLEETGRRNSRSLSVFNAARVRVRAKEYPQAFVVIGPPAALSIRIEWNHRLNCFVRTNGM
jgi:hypothetical protein